MPVKVIWDYTFYWGILCQIFFQRRLTDLSSISRVTADLNQARVLNFAMQKFMREWSQSSRKRNAPIVLDQASLPWFAELNRGLRDELDEAGFRTRIKESTAQLVALAREIMDRACAQSPELDAAEVRALLGDALPAAEPMLFAESYDASERMAKARMAG
jgi:hypothetical protein